MPNAECQAIEAVYLEVARKIPETVWHRVHIGVAKTKKGRGKERRMHQILKRIEPFYSLCDSKK